MERIGRYEIVDCVAAGEAGRVYHARDPLLGRSVAIFLFPDWQSQDLGERKLAQFSSHPCIVDIHDVGIHEGQPYHVLEYVDGRSLADLIGAGVRITTDALLSLAEAIAGALQHMHSRGVLHNAVTPANIVMRSSGEPVLVDFRRASDIDGSTVMTDLRGLADTMASVLSGKLGMVGDDELASCAPGYVLELLRRCRDGGFRDAQQLARSIHVAIDALDSADGPTRRFEAREGDTVLLHADNRDVDRPGAYREYLIEQHISGGGFGDVYRAIDRTSGARVALKVLKRHLLADADAVARFRREADVLAYLEHPNIVRIYNYGRYSGTVFIAMELLEGETLSAIRRRQAPMDLEQAVGYVVPVLRALDVLSTAGIVHRDVKPTNVKVTEGRVVLLDFGIASVEGWEPLTDDAAFIGTVRYASPEQVSGRAITPASDVHAAGVVLYELLTGAVPHGRCDATAMLVRIATESAPSIDVHRSDLPPRISTLLADMLAIDPKRRPTAAEAAAALTAG